VEEQERPIQKRKTERRTPVSEKSSNYSRHRTLSDYNRLLLRKAEQDFGRGGM